MLKLWCLFLNGPNARLQSIDNPFLIYFGCFFKTNENVQGRANRENDSVVSSTHTAPLLCLTLSIGL